MQFKLGTVIFLISYVAAFNPAKNSDELMSFDDLAKEIDNMIISQPLYIQLDKKKLSNSNSNGKSSNSDSNSSSISNSSNKKEDDFSLDKLIKEIEDLLKGTPDSYLNGHEESSKKPISYQAGSKASSHLRKNKLDKKESNKKEKNNKNVDLKKEENKNKSSKGKNKNLTKKENENKKNSNKNIKEEIKKKRKEYLKEKKNKKFDDSDLFIIEFDFGKKKPSSSINIDPFVVASYGYGKRNHSKFEKLRKMKNKEKYMKKSRLPSKNDFSYDKKKNFSFEELAIPEDQLHSMEGIIHTWSDSSKELGWWERLKKWWEGEEDNDEDKDEEENPFKPLYSKKQNQIYSKKSPYENEEEEFEFSFFERLSLAVILSSIATLLIMLVGKVFSLFFKKRRHDYSRLELN